MEDIFLKIVILLQGSFIALGVGSSALVIASFLTAIANDDTIDLGERRMLGVIYIALRLAMVGILVMTGCIQIFIPELYAPIASYIWILIAILFLNAILMSKHLISSRIGPSLQAATWLSFGFLMTMYNFNLFEITPTFFGVLYGAVFIFTLVLVNSVISFVRSRT